MISNPLDSPELRGPWKQKGNVILGKRVILKNAAKCLSCKETVESKHRHDFVTCGCGKVSVDGGKEYLRRSFNGPYEDLSVEE